MGDEPKTVWVVGSGFSRSLGGPLLKDLLSRKALDEVIETFAHLPDLQSVYAMFERLRSSSTTSGYWEDAEQFLDFVDTARDDRVPRSKLLKAIFGQLSRPLEGGEVFHRKALIAIAAECSTFTARADLKSEAWAPYVKWANRLEEGDSIVTFNYDTVVEKVAAYLRDNKPKGMPRPLVDPVMLPNTPATGLSGVGFPRIYKLHGSVNWNSDGKVHDLFERGKWDRSEAVLFDKHTPLIAGPGPDKNVKCTGPFKGIWEDAKLSLETADALVFLGYRFPPSDSEARSTLLNAIHDNDQRSLSVHIVLGPDLHQPANVRLLALLRGVLQSRGRHELGTAQAFSQYESKKARFFRLVEHPLWVEDFLSLPKTWNLHQPVFTPP